MNNAVSLKQIMQICRGRQYSVMCNSEGIATEIVVQSTHKKIADKIAERFSIRFEGDHFVACNATLPDGWVSLENEGDLIDFDNHLQATAVALRTDLKKH